jgi:hypothetical protein
MVGHVAEYRSITRDAVSPGESKVLDLCYKIGMNEKAKNIVSIIGGVVACAGVLCALIGYFGSAYVFFESDRTFLGLIALFVPPADVVLGFVAHPILGTMATGGMLVAYVGFILVVANE